MKSAGGAMKGLKVWRMICAYGGVVSLIGVCGGLPLMFKQANVGEATVLQLLYIIFGAACLLVGVLRFFLSSKARGIPFLFAALALLAAMLGLSPLQRSLWLELALFISGLGAIIGFWPSSKVVASGT
jgi:hypothetical protein